MSRPTTQPPHTTTFRLYNREKVFRPTTVHVLDDAARSWSHTSLRVQDAHVRTTTDVRGAAAESLTVAGMSLRQPTRDGNVSRDDIVHVLEQAAVQGHQLRAVTWWLTKVASQVNS